MVYCRIHTHGGTTGIFATSSLATKYGTLAILALSKSARRLEAIKPLRAVYGNIDGQELRTIYPKNQRFTIEGADVWITHIGGYPGKYDTAVVPEIFRNPPDLFVSGHSHILKVMYDKKLQLLHINPGAAGKYGFHKQRTLVRFSVEEGRFKDLEVIELADDQR